jgi:hypothetical protein
MDEYSISTTPFYSPSPPCKALKTSPGISHWVVSSKGHCVGRGRLPSYRIFPVIAGVWRYNHSKHYGKDRNLNNYFFMSSSTLFGELYLDVYHLYPITKTFQRHKCPLCEPSVTGETPEVRSFEIKK